MYVQEIEKLDASAADFEEHIRTHPLMQAELLQQRAELNMIARDEVDVDYIRRLRTQRRSPSRSNIGLAA